MNATGVTAGPAESNGKLLPGLWRDSLHVTCGLTACTPGSAPGPTLGNEYGKTLPFYPQNGDRIATVDTVTSLHTIYTGFKGAMASLAKATKYSETEYLTALVWPHLHLSRYIVYEFEISPPSTNSLIPDNDPGGDRLG